MEHLTRKGTLASVSNFFMDHGKWSIFHQPNHTDTKGYRMTRIRAGLILTIEILTTYMDYGQFELECGWANSLARGK